MRRKPYKTPMNAAAVARLLAAIATMSAFFGLPANAVQPPSEQCRAASKIEYDSANKQHLLRNRFGAYVRTGRPWRRHYWYCQL
jgi:hypothetical protein